VKPAYLLSPKARRDIAEIWTETVKVWGAQQAEDYIRQIQASIELIARSPAIARPCDEIRPGYRRYTSGSHVLFVRLRQQGIEVIRILHGRMDFGRWL
jgi:toxin ParE1/3/4